MKQIDFKQNISVTKSDLRGMFEILVYTENGTNTVQMVTGGTIGSFLPSNLINNNGSLFSSPVGPRWYLCIEGNTNSIGQVTSATMVIRNSLPRPIAVTSNIPPTFFTFPIYAGVGSSFVRLVGPSPVLRPILMYQQFEVKYNTAATNFTNFYSLSFV